MCYLIGDTQRYKNRILILEICPVYSFAASTLTDKRNPDMKIAIADDHGLVREGLVYLLAQVNGVSAVFDAGSIPEVINVLHAHDDMALALLDLDMPGMHGVETLAQLQDGFPHVPFAILSATETVPIARRYLDAGALGYIPKSASNEAICSAVRLILTGNIYVPPFALHEVVEPEPSVKLTNRQTATLELMSQGLSNKAIARDMNISESTVKKHSIGIFKALDVNNRMLAVSEARRIGIIAEPS